MSINELVASLTREQKSELLARLLNELNWGPRNPVTPLEFDAICGAFTTTGCELMVLRDRRHRSVDQDRYEVLLIQRPENDKFYAGQWHGPGSIRRGHEPDSSVMERLVTGELREAELGRTFYLRTNIFQTPRGQEITRLYVARMTHYRGPGRWFNLNALPGNVIKHHLELIQQVKNWLIDHEL